MGMDEVAENGGLIFTILLSEINLHKEKSHKSIEVILYKFQILISKIKNKLTITL